MTVETVRFIPAQHISPRQELHFPKFEVYPDVPQNLARPTYKGPSLLSGIGRLNGLGSLGMEPGAQAIVGIAVLASIGASAFHGYRRNNSVGWGVWWALMGGLFPVVTPAIALAQGFGKRSGR